MKQSSDVSIHKRLTFFFVLLLGLGFQTVLIQNANAALDPAKNPLLNIDFKKYMEGLSDDYVVEKMDSVGKGTNDMFVVFKKTDGQTRVLVSQLFDFNRDGKVDLANHFTKGKKAKAEYDLDFDGKVDSISEFDPETGDLFKKVQIENGSLIWRYWFKGELRRREVDRNGDGEPDLWVHYRDGKVIKSEVDVNFDGKNIRLEGDLNKKTN